MLETLRNLWLQASTSQRVVLLGAVLTCGIAGTVLVGWASQPDLALLFSQLSPEEAAKVVEKIRDAGLPYDLKNGGTSVYAPSDQIYSLRLTMAQQGMPTGGEQAGYRILDDKPLGQSPMDQRINFNRAIEGELARSIQTLDGVGSARVHIAKPEATLFGKEKHASATVVITLHGGHRLTPNNVAAIVHLVAGGVNGLAPTGVVVVDSSGNLLSGEDDSGMGTHASSTLDYQMQVETYLADKAEGMLTAMLGPNKASVQVSVDVDMSSQEETIETYDTESQIVAKETIEKSTIPQQSAVEGAAPPGSQKDEKSEFEYLPPPKTIKRVVEMPGKISSISASVLVDLSQPAIPEPAEGAEADQTQPEPVARLTIEEIGEIVAKSINADPADIVVKSTSFHHPAFYSSDTAEKAGMFSLDFLLELAKRSSLGVLVIGALLALKVFAAPPKGQSQISAEGQLALATSSGAINSSGDAAGGDNLLPTEADAINAEALRSQISNALQENPEEVKRLFLSWAESEKGA